MNMIIVIFVMYETDFKDYYIMTIMNMISEMWYCM